MSSKSWESSCVIGVLLLIPCSPFHAIIVQGWSCVCPQILFVPGAGELEAGRFFSSCLSCLGFGFPHPVDAKAAAVGCWSGEQLLEWPALSCSSGTALVSFRLFPKHLARLWNILV